jgi:hypothetical protein
MEFPDVCDDVVDGESSGREENDRVFVSLERW